MAEIKEFKPSTPPFQEKAGQAKERPKPAAPSERASLNENEREKPAKIFDIEEARKKVAAREATSKALFDFPDIESQELMETVSGLVKKLFEDSRDKKTVVEQLRKLTDELEQKLKK